MDIHNVYDYGNTDEAIINHIGAVIYEDGPHAQSNASPGSNRADHELSTEDHHDGPDFADLTSHLHDVDPLPEGFELGSNDAPVFRDESTPWHSAWASDILGSHPKANEPLAPTSQTDVNGGCDSEIDPRWVCEACEAHSSMNGISGWPDFSRDEDLLECSCMDLPTDNTSFVSPSSSAQLVSVVLPQSLSPTTSMSRQDTQAGVAAVGASAIDESSASSYTRPARSAGRKDSLHDDKPGQSFASDEAAAQVSASPTNSASAARPHLCSDCGAGFKTRAGVAYALPSLENEVTAKDD
ncbi:hypothetical protein MBLNU13_g10566t1 [Cladosporium sp. NU13]